MKLLSKLNEAALDAAIKGEPLSHYSFSMGYGLYGWKNFTNYLAAASAYKNLIEHCRECKTCAEKIVKLFETPSQDTQESLTSQQSIPTERNETNEAIESIETKIDYITGVLHALGIMDDIEVESLERL